MPWDLSYLGGPADSAVLDGIVQEVDIETGQVLFEWHSLEHVAFEESYYEPPPDLKTSFDYFHINSIDIFDDEHLLISAGRTSTVYKVDRKSGEVAWRLGGKRSDFDMGLGTRTDYQHDARYHPGGIITVFDNGRVKKNEQSRGIVLKLDEALACCIAWNLLLNTTRASGFDVIAPIIRVSWEDVGSGMVALLIYSPDFVREGLLETQPQWE